ncbi:hypothetical protein PVL29_000718 [Vitis rotundifolia]|uniref:Uncharacterized protein n=1 Tax=Vitis rotundifolia TaxID=103349 RepID=A0AA39AKR6_VITRO|nr:hypothetical protein PVL29_000718 [Vitis rotundifolia]
MVRSNPSFEIWQNLEKLFVSHSKACIMQYKIQLQTTRKGGSIMIEYLLKIKKDQILHVLVGLGSKCDSFVASISLGFELCRMQDIVALLLAHKNRLENATF